MKNFFYLLASAALLATPAIAADMPVKAPAAYAAPAPMFNWTGFYVGAHVGAGWSNVDARFSGVTPAWDHDGDGWFGGAQLGYNVQAGAFVYGIEGDGSWGKIDGDTRCPNPAFRCGSDAKQLYSIRGRAGFTAMDSRTLIYGTAGWGWAEIKYSALPIAGGFRNTVWNDGPVVGAGVEFAATPNWTWKLEYMAYLFDGKTISDAPLASGTARVDPTIQTVKLGVNYKW